MMTKEEYDKGIATKYVPFFKEETPKSKLIIGNITIFFTKKFNWFNRLMLKLVFGLKIENVKEIEK